MEELQHSLGETVGELSNFLEVTFLTVCAQALLLLTLMGLLLLTLAIRLA